jgi:tetratricopeptide (TPR) repeat protein
MRFLAVWVVMLAAAASFGCSRSPEEQEARFLERGKKRLEERDHARAVLEFNNALRVNPKNAESHYQIGMAYLGSGRAQEGAMHLQKAAELDPKHSAAQLKLAELMLLARVESFVPKVEEKVLEVLADHPEDSEALFVLAATQVRLGRPQEAEKYLREALEKSPQHLRSSLGLAQMKIGANDLKGAETVLAEAVRQDPKSVDALVALGVFYAATGKPAEAEARFRLALEADAKSAPALLQLAALQMRQGKKQDAEQSYRQLSALGVKEFRPALGIYYMQEKKLDAAIAEFERLAKADRDDRDSRNRLVAAYLAAGRIADAEKVLGEALERNAKDGDALVQRARLHLRSGDVEKAQNDMAIVLKLRPDWAEAHFLMAGVHRAAGAGMQHRQALSEAIRFSPGYLAARLQLASTLVAGGEAKAALDLLDAAPEQQKKSLPVLVARNWALIGLGDAAGARKGVDRLLAEAKSPELLMQDAVLKAGAKNWAGARASAEEILNANPGDLRALRMLGSVYAVQKQMPAGTEKLKHYAAQRPDSPEVQMLFARWLLEAGQRAEARTTLGTVKAAPAAILLAQMDMQDGQLDAARQRMRNVLASNEKDLASRLLLAGIEEQSGNRAGAVEEYHKVVQARSIERGCAE